MRNLDIGIDLDGVCYDFTASLRHYLIEHEGWSPGILTDASTWSFYQDDWGMSADEFLKACDRGVDAGVIFLHGEPYEDTVDTLWGLRRKGHRLHIITARSFGTRTHRNTSEWLDRHQVPFDSLIFTPHKGVFRPDVMLDDYEGNFVSMREMGVDVYLFDRPWNTHVDDEGFRVSSWQDFEAKIDQIAEEDFDGK